jgi:hypothetical protein
MEASMSCSIRLSASLLLLCALNPYASAATTAPRDNSLGNPTTANATRQPNISGIWKVSPYVFATRPQSERALKSSDGTPAPLQPWAAEVYKKRMDESDAGHPFAASVAYCLPGGMPAMMLGAPYPIQFIQSPNQVTTLHEENHLFRIIYLNGTHPDDLESTFMGHSTGKWQGDTLVVDTVGLNDRTTMDFNGMPHSDQLHVTERIRRVDQNTLENVMTFEDPKTFTRSWQTRRTYALLPPEEHILEYVCENQRNTPESGVSGFGK